MGDDRRWILQPGALFGRYEIVRPIGRGGMGEVYLVRNPRLDRNEALKTLFPYLMLDDRMQRRFEREATLAAHLDHPNIVSVYDADKDAESGLSWIAMKYIPGVDAARLLAYSDGVIPVARVVDIIAQSAAGLDEAHQRGLLHRDVKPANLLISGDWDGRPGSQRVCVSDFGIARTLSNTTALTADGAFLGTLLYAAPESFDSTERVDHRADVYSLGATLYQLLTGSPPFERTDPAAMMHAHLSCRVPRASDRRSDVPRALDDVIATAMAKAPDDRFQTCCEIAEAATDAVCRQMHSWSAGSAASSGLTTTRTSDARPLPPRYERPNNADRTSIMRAADIAALTPPPLPPRDSQFAYADAPAPPFQSAGDYGTRPNRRRNALVGLLLAALALAVAVGSIVWWPGRGDDAEEAGPTFEAMQAFLREHYALLPRQTQEAWNNLTPKLQRETGGYGEFVKYWSTTSSVALSDAEQRGPYQVGYRLDVINLDRTVGTETRVATLIRRGDQFKIDEINTESLTMPNRPSSTRPAVAPTGPR